MRFGETLKKIRNEKNDSLRKLASKVGVSFAYINQIEKGITPASESFFDKLLTIYSDKKQELSEAYCSEVLPKQVIKDIEDEGIRFKKLDLEYMKMKLYKFDSKKNGTSDYIYKEMVIPMNTINNNLEVFTIEIEGNELENFYDKDVILIEKTENEIEMLNKKIIAIEINNIVFLRKVNIIKYIPYLESLNRVYKPIKYNCNEMKILGVAIGLLYRDLKNLKF